jgi:hypothetical protein
LDNNYRKKQKCIVLKILLDIFVELWIKEFMKTQVEPIDKYFSNGGLAQVFCEGKVKERKGSGERKKSNEFRIYKCGAGLMPVFYIKNGEFYLPSK